MKSKPRKIYAEDVIQAWKDYEGNVVQARKPYEDSLIKAMKNYKDTKKMKIYKVETMGETTLITAKNRNEAYARFFLDIKEGRYPMDKIGGIIMVTDPDDGNEYPFRTTPTLWLMELIPPETAFVIIEKMLDLDSSSDDSANLLLQSAKKDMWILDEINRLEANSP